MSRALQYPLGMSELDAETGLPVNNASLGMSELDAETGLPVNNAFAGLSPIFKEGSRHIPPSLPAPYGPLSDPAVRKNIQNFQNACYYFLVQFLTSGGNTPRLRDSCVSGDRGCALFVHVGSKLLKTAYFEHFWWVQAYGF